MGESAEKYALPWDEIAPTRYQAAGWIPPELIQELERLHQARVATDPDYRDYLADVAKAEQARQQKVVSLQLAKRKAEQEQLRAQQRERENRRRVALGMKPLDDGDELPEIDPKNAPDPLLNESVHIVADMIRLQSQPESFFVKKPRVGAALRPDAPPGTPAPAGGRIEEGRSQAALARCRTMTLSPRYARSARGGPYPLLHGEVRPVQHGL